jgi:hypothetical protein
MLVSLVNKAPTLGYLFLSGSLEFSLVHFSGGTFSKGIMIIWLLGPGFLGLSFTAILVGPP